MPLLKGGSDKIVSQNIKELMSTGKYSQAQAIAIAFRKAGRSKPDKK